MTHFLKKGFFVNQITQNGELIIGGLNNLKGANSPNSGRPLLQLAKIQITQSGF